MTFSPSVVPGRSSVESERERGRVGRKGGREWNRLGLTKRWF